ncbi:hypothetical protein Pelo_6937 [Pelomyxa schiedti]|nr:hypothetical protein Pelo_6937 [Pelomyxa schiedti]
MNALQRHAGGDADNNNTSNSNGNATHPGDDEVPTETGPKRSRVAAVEGTTALLLPIFSRTNAHVSTRTSWAPIPDAPQPPPPPPPQPQPQPQPPPAAPAPLADGGGVVVDPQQQQQQQQEQQQQQQANAAAFIAQQQQQQAQQQVAALRQHQQRVMRFKIPMVGLDKKTGLSVSAPSAPCVVSVTTKAHLMALMYGGGGGGGGGCGADADASNAATVSGGALSAETGVQGDGMTPDREAQDREPERQWLCTYAHRDWKEYELVIVNFPPQEPRIALSDSWWLTQRPLSGIPSQVRLGNLTVTKRNTTSHKLYLRVLVFHENIWWETPWVIITAGLSLQQQQAIRPLFMSPPKVVQQAVPQVSPFVNTGPSSQSVQEVMRLREILQRQQESTAASRPCESFPTSPTDLSINPRNIKFTGIRFELHLPNAMVTNWAERVWNELCVDTMLNWGTLVEKFRHDFNQDLTPLKALVCGPDNTISKKLWYGLAHHLVYARDKYIFCDAAAIELWKTARWFHGVCSKFQAESRLHLAHQTTQADAERNSNTFLWLMRLSEIEPSLFDLSFKAKLCIYHMRIGHCRPGDTHYWTGSTPVFEPIPPNKYGIGGQYYIVNSDKVADTLDELVKKVLGNSSAELHEVHRPDLIIPDPMPAESDGTTTTTVTGVFTASTPTITPSLCSVGSPSHPSCSPITTVIQQQTSSTTSTTGGGHC